MYESVSNAIRNIVNENDSEKLKSENINKSRLQLKVNFPEVNPAFDTYRLGTILEMVRHSCVEECFRLYLITHIDITTDSVLSTDLLVLLLLPTPSTATSTYSFSSNSPMLPAYTHACLTPLISFQLISIMLTCGLRISSLYTVDLAFNDPPYNTSSVSSVGTTRRPGPHCGGGQEGARVCTAGTGRGYLRGPASLSVQHATHTRSLYLFPADVEDL